MSDITNPRIRFDISESGLDNESPSAGQVLTGAATGGAQGGTQEQRDTSGSSVGSHDDNVQVQLILGEDPPPPSPGIGSVLSSGAKGGTKGGTGS